MANKTITIDISVGSIQKAIRTLQDYKKSIEKRMQGLIDMMCSDGASLAYTYLEHIDTGETLNSIIGYREGNKGIIEVGGNAIWIEFGTGVTYNQGGDNMHPNRGELGISDWGTYGEGHGSDPNGWYYYDAQGKRKHTFGIPENPFMAQAARRLAEQFASKAKGAFLKLGDIK